MNRREALAAMGAAVAGAPAVASTTGDFYAQLVQQWRIGKDEMRRLESITGDGIRVLCWTDGEIELRPLEFPKFRAYETASVLMVLDKNHRGAMESLSGWIELREREKETGIRYCFPYLPQNTARFWEASLKYDAIHVDDRVYASLSLRRWLGEWDSSASSPIPRAVVS